MDVTDVTVGIPVRELESACRWYERVFGLEGPTYEPADGVVEYELGGCWLQLSVDRPGPSRWVFRVGVTDVAAERDRLVSLGIEVGPLEVVEGAVAYFEFADPDGNLLSCYTEEPG